MSTINDFFDSIDFDKKIRTKKQPKLIFLCGGGDAEEDKFFRPKILKELKRRGHEHRVVRAEDVMNWQVSQAFGKDLLELEKCIAAPVSVIPIVCESPGAIAELGAFVSDEIIREKLYLIIEEKYYVGDESNSFIRWGPIENYEKNVGRQPYCFSKETLEDDLYAICDALIDFELSTDTCNFSKSYFQILLLIDIINILSVADIQEITKAMSYALKQADKESLKDKEIEGMIVVLQELGLIKERAKGEGNKYIVAKNKRFYISYAYKDSPKYKDVTEAKKHILKKIYSSDKVKASIIREETNKGEIEWLKNIDLSQLQIQNQDNVLKKAPLLYKVYEIPKKNGGKRIIAQPTPGLKKLQREAVQELAKKLSVHECAKAYVENKNGILENAQDHKDNNYFFKYDFKDFFPSIKAADFNICLEKAGYEEPKRIDFLKTIFRFDKEKNKKNIPEIYGKLNNMEFNQNTNAALLKLMVEDFRDAFQLSIGAPSSPFVSNVIMFDFDMRMDEWAKANDFVYTRFADDITISCQKKKNPEEITAVLKEKLEGLEYPKLRLNDSKQKSVSFNNRVTITGLNITPDHKISLGRKKKKEIRVMIHHYQCNKFPKHRINELSGWLAYAKAVDNEFFKAMEKKYTPECIKGILSMPKQKRY